jgi:type I restriction enzyme S subunit
MNTKLLKQKILDLAIRGKLTDQRKSDGTAADLLTQISDERRKTRDERKGTRSKKSGVILSEAQSAKSKDLGQIIPLDKNEAPFEIPDNWEWVRLGDYLDVRDGTHDSPKYVENGYPFVTSKNLTNGLIDFSTCKRISKLDFEKFEERSHVDEGDILYAMIGSIGNPVLVKKTCDFAIKNVALFKKRNEFTDMHFVFYWLQFVEKDLKVNAAGGLQPFVSLSMFRERCFPLPPLAEQQRIVAKIEEAFAEIDAIEKNKELLKTHIKQTRQKILDLAIHGKLVPQNKSDEPASVLLERITRDNPHYEKLTDIPFEIPESWEWVNAEDLFNIRSAIRIHQTDWQKEGIPFFRGRELVQLCKTGNVDFEIYISEKLYEENKRKGGVPQKNDILVSAVGTLGFAYVVKGNKPFYYKDAYILCFENRHNLNPFYFQHLIHSKFINKIIYGGSKGTTVDQLTIENAKKLPMPLPPLAEQKRIVNKIDEIFASLDEISLHLV